MSGSAWPEPPAGFVLRSNGVTALYVAVQAEAEVRERGLHSWEAWPSATAGHAAVSGRGSTAVHAGRSGARWRLKIMRRGGGLARLWSDRYPSSRRLLEALSISAEALSRGVRTARPIVLIVEPGRWGWVRAAMAFEELEDAEDLALRAKRGAATREELTAVLRAIRSMHDRGVHHPDLNLGNILIRHRDRASIEAFVIDFDRATITAGPLPFAARQASLRRMERSCAKLTGAPGLFGPGSEDLWYSIYADGDAELSRRLAGGRWLGRLALAFHRMGWRGHPP